MQEVQVSVTRMPNILDPNTFEEANTVFGKSSIIHESERQKEKFMLWLTGDDLDFRIPERMIKSGITDSWFIALNCFSIQQYPATILMASIAVETLLNHDKRLYDYRMSLKKDKWIYLSLENLRVAQKNGIDITWLLDKDKKHSEFVQRRNKIAHGHYSGYSTYLFETRPNREIMEKIMVTRKHALNQLYRSFRFITAWADAKPIIILDQNERISTRLTNRH